ncbi:MAG TPA: TetR/AcrR family transcriptional regulator [Sphingomicrobium sp.]|jgi:AcrR family transcriptional regulator|nr:TetR/AcrR family transcriptional regulator [Sphingomicrobium sp.]
MPRNAHNIAPSRNGGEPTQQALKSAQTRARLIESTIRCLVKFGYSGTTTPKVASEAGLSRGAMLHHFENGGALMQATIAELLDRRLRAFRRAVGSPSSDVRTLVRTYWKQLLSPSFVAFIELAIAARTDKNLARILEPAQAEFRERWYELAVQLFPAWQQDRKAFDLALALTQNTVEGMAINRLIHGCDERMIDSVLDNLEAQIVALRPKPKG